MNAYVLCRICRGTGSAFDGLPCCFCTGHGYDVRALNPGAFAPRDRIVHAYSGEEWEVLRHRRDGTTLMGNVDTGDVQALNSLNNPHFVSAQDAIAEATWALPEGLGVERKHGRT